MRQSSVVKIFGRPAGFARSIAALLLVASGAFSQNTAPASAPPQPPSPVTGIRNKVSAGDLLSAESILEVHRAKNGEDGPWLVGLSWLARGALLTGDTSKAKRYVSQVRSACADRIARGGELTGDRDLEIAYGAAIEVNAQLLEGTQGVTQAAEYLRTELAVVNAPASLVSRLYKRLNILTLTGQPAPDIIVEDFIGASPPVLSALRNKPMLLFIWAEWCGDCKAQAAALGTIRSRYADRGLEVVALTRYYDEEPDRAREKKRIDSVWTAVYASLGPVPIVISTASMERYGGSSTPTLVFVDRFGLVRRYTPTRLTEEELIRTVDLLLE
jgi:thiol-disulfide isomerase/thioredoxin